jgi:hypothetical protein
MHRIIKLKRYERPPEGWHEEFLEEFRHRQRAELLRIPVYRLLWDRFHAMIHSVSVPPLAYAGAAALAVLVGTGILRSTASSPAAYAVSYPSYPVTIPKMQPVSLRVTPPSEETPPPTPMPPSYFLQARPVHNESPLSF